MFQGSPDSKGFLLWMVAAAGPGLPLGLPGPSETVAACPPLLGDPVAFDISSSVPESGYSGLVIPVSSASVRNYVDASVLFCTDGTAPGLFSQSGRWSSAIPQTRNITREGPFDVYCSPIDTGDYPLVSTGLPGCPYRFTSYTAPPVADTDPAFGIQLHHPRFLEFVVAPESA